MNIFENSRTICDHNYYTDYVFGIICNRLKLGAERGQPYLFTGININYWICVP